MFRGYRTLFAPPGAVPLSLVVLVARFPSGMSSLAATMLVTALHGSYGRAGLGGAVVLAAIAVTGPYQARLVDRYGQTRVSVPAVLLATLGCAVTMAALYGHAPTWAYLLGCALSGVGPNTGSLARARWAYLHRGDEGALHTAYAYEGVVDELCYILGPVAAIGLATAVSPPAGYAAAVLLSLFGVLGLATQRRTEPPPANAPAPAPANAKAPAALRGRGLTMLVLVLAATGGVFGTMEITTVGFAQAHGDKAGAGLVLSCYALGSFLSGLAFGLWRPRGRSVVRMRWALAAMALSLAPLPLARTLPEVAAVLFVSGFTTAPTISTSMGMVRELVPPTRLTEGFTWTTTGLLVGVSAGTAAGGWAVDHLAPGAGYHVPAAAALLALLLSARLAPGRASHRQAAASPRSPERRQAGRPRS